VTEINLPINFWFSGTGTGQGAIRNATSRRVVDYEVQLCQTWSRAKYDLKELVDNDLRSLQLNKVDTVSCIKWRRLNERKLDLL